MENILKGSDLSIPSKRKDANKNTEKVLKAAYKVFADKGYDATIEEIAAEAGVGVGTVHRRFSNKTVLALAVITDVFSKIKDDQLALIRTPMPVDQKIRLLFEKFSISHIQNGKIHALALQLATAGELGEEMRNSFLFGLDGGLKEVIVQGQQEGKFRDGDPKLLETLIINMINPNLVMKLKELLPADQIARHVSDMILFGLMKK
ncbi:TetR/AcrR family transcriptional regulator [Paenibacillus arenilitoris]|uniref:TetR/AcrR family transcriptional regulator n=1 Tax=Paenibacillus arenilitoris TaxID=2772299 RepID=A0A927CJG2_9BACL|nr:TetR/AcrR family transcriptional regulator [Paenibacillus arenilitoris]MBD2868227.1 TetR/AcrR family transcriptional regulator [Paenibacillus arenilitoris]